MWLDAFKPNSRDRQKHGVPGVPSVPATANQASTRVSRNAALGHRGNVPVSHGVPTEETSPAWDIRDTLGHHDKTKCPSDAIDCKPYPHAGFCLDGTPGTPQKHDFPKHTGDIAESLAQFRFDLVQEDMGAGIPCEEIHRINNMAWEFMQVDGMGFDAAIKLAAQIVVHGQVTACEAAYVDVMALFKRLQTNDWKSA